MGAEFHDKQSNKSTTTVLWNRRDVVQELFKNFEWTITLYPPTFRLVIYSQLLHYMSRMFLWASGSIICLAIQYNICDEQLSMIKLYINIFTGWSRANSAIQHLGIFITAINIFPGNTACYVTQHDVIWQIHQFYDLLCQFGSVRLSVRLIKSCDDCVGGKCVHLKIFVNMPSFASGLGFLMNAENLAKMSMPAVFDSGCLAASLMYLQTGLTHEYQRKTCPHPYLLYGILDWSAVLLKEIFVSISDTPKADGWSTEEGIWVSRQNSTVVFSTLGLTQCSCHSC